MAPPSKQEIEDTMIAAETATGSKWPGMSYENGVAAALRWVTGNDDTNPLEDE